MSHQVLLLISIDPTDHHPTGQHPIPIHITTTDYNYFLFVMTVSSPLEAAGNQAVAVVSVRGDELHTFVPREGHHGFIQKP